MAGVLANLVRFTKLNRYLFLTEGIVISLWKKENGGAVSLLIIFYATALFNDMYTCACPVLKHSVKLKLASYT